MSIGLSRPNAVLRSTNNPANVGGYRVWYSAKPYLQPGDAAATSVNLPAGSTGWTHNGAAGTGGVLVGVELPMVRRRIVYRVELDGGAGPGYPWWFGRQGGRCWKSCINGSEGRDG